MLTRAHPHSPLADDELDTLFRDLEGARGVGLAVSGGADSVALMVLFARWQALRGGGPDALVLGVDHGLRPDSGDDIRKVVTWAQALGLPVRALEWTGAKPETDLQAAARRARYALMADALEAAGFTHLVTAHHLEDQAETFLLRLAGGSGPHGLGGMAPVGRRGRLTVVRPFLSVPKARLVATLEAAGQDWVEDPSNRDPRFARARLRALMPALAELGLTAERLADAAAHLRQTSAAIDAMAARFLSENGTAHPAGPHVFDFAGFSALPEAVAQRLLSVLVRFHGETGYPPRTTKRDDLLGALVTGEGVKRTLGRAVVERSGATVWIYPEAGRRGARDLALAPGEAAETGRAGRVALSQEAPGAVRIAPLGADGRRVLAGEGIAAPKAMPRAGYEASLAVWHEDAPVFVPVSDWAAEAWRGQVEFEPGDPFGGPPEAADRARAYHSSNF